jgi:hypothetical protein
MMFYVSKRSILQLRPLFIVLSHGIVAKDDFCSPFASRPRGCKLLVDSRGEVLRAVSLPYVCRAVVFTRNLDLAMRTCRRLEASAVMVNDHTAFQGDWMSFAGPCEFGLGLGTLPGLCRQAVFG